MKIFSTIKNPPIKKNVDVTIVYMQGKPYLEFALKEPSGILVEVTKCLLSPGDIFRLEIPFKDITVDIKFKEV